MMLDSGDSVQGGCKTMANPVSTSFPPRTDNNSSALAKETMAASTAAGDSKSGEHAGGAQRKGSDKRKDDADDETGGKTSDTEVSMKEEDKDGEPGEEEEGEEAGEEEEEEQDKDEEDDSSSAQSKGEEGSALSSSKTQKFVCEMCRKEFGTKGSLKTHNRVHTGEKPFVCPVQGCGRGFSQHPNCIRHIRLLHPGVNLKSISGKIHATAKTKTGKRLRLMEQNAHLGSSSGNVGGGVRTQNQAETIPASFGGLSFLRPPMEAVVPQFAYQAVAAPQHQQPSMEQAMQMAAYYSAAPQRVQQQHFHAVQQQQQQQPHQVMYSPYGMVQCQSMPNPAAAYMNVTRLSAAAPSGLMFPPTTGVQAPMQAGGILQPQHLIPYMSQAPPAVQHHPLAMGANRAGLQMQTPPNQAWMFSQQQQKQQQQQMGGGPTLGGHPSTGMPMAPPRGQQDH